MEFTFIFCEKNNPIATQGICQLQQSDKVQTMQNQHYTENNQKSRMGKRKQNYNVYRIKKRQKNNIAKNHRLVVLLLLVFAFYTNQT